jgi:hypothetical protein
MSYACPACAGEHTQRVALMYSEDTRRSTRSNGRRGTGSSQSDLAAMHAPPQSRGTTGRTIFLVVVALMLVGQLAQVLILRSSAVKLVVAIPFLSLLAGVLVWSILKTKKYNATVYEPGMQLWKASFLCKSCGRLFLPDLSVGVARDSVYVEAVAVNGGTEKARLG